MDDRVNDPHSTRAVGERIKDIRIARGWTQAYLAKLLNVGTSTVGMWESGKSKPKTDQAVEICKLYPVTFNWLFGGNDETLALEIKRQLKSARKSRS